MGLLSILGLGGKSESIQEFISKGAIIIDVRTSGEFQNGHIKGAKNIPLNTVSEKVAEIKKINKPIIVCCHSGMRSAQAAAFLRSNDVKVLNGGGWQSLQSKL